MADRRLVAQSITNSGQVAQLVKKCGPWGAVLFTWVLTFIDDDSRFEGDPETLRHKVLGRYLDHVNAELIAEIVSTMNDIDLAVWYEVVDSPGERYLYFPRFTVHQTLREDRYGPSRLPAPPNWRPEEGHPYAKNAARQAAWKPGQSVVSDLRKDKPQRDLRRTVRVPRRPANKGQQALWETTAQPAGASGATAPQPPGHAAGTEDASRLAAPPRAATPLDTSRLASAEPSLSREADELRSSTTPSPDEVLEGATGTWRTALETMHAQLTSGAFVTWFQGTRLEERDVVDANEQRRQQLYVVAPNAFARQWIESKYAPLIRAAIGMAIDDVAVDVRIVLEGELPAVVVEDVAP